MNVRKEGKRLPMKARDERFFGSGNFQDHNGKGWMIGCQCCPAIEVLKIAGVIEPRAVIKWFRDLGWHIGGSDEDDTCPACLQRDELTAMEAVTGVIVEKPIQTQHKNIEKFQEKYNRDFFDEEKQAALKAEIARLRNKLGEKPGDLLITRIRQVHELLLQDQVELALLVIEETFPDQYWEHRIPKAKGSIKPKQQAVNDPNFEHWLEEEQKKHNAT